MSTKSKVTRLCLLKPTAGRIVVERNEFKYEGRIIVPDKAQRKPTIGTVIAIGEMTDAPCAIGDKILFAQYSGTEVQLRNQPLYVVLTRDEVIAIIDKDAEIALDVVAM